MTVKEILQNEFWYMRNRDMHIDSATKRIYELIAYEMFNSCCAFEKMMSLPREKRIKKLRKLFHGQDTT